MGFFGPQPSPAHAFVFHASPPQLLSTQWEGPFPDQELSQAFTGCGVGFLVGFGRHPYQAGLLFHRFWFQAGLLFHPFQAGLLFHPFQALTGRRVGLLHPSQAGAFQAGGLGLLHPFQAGAFHTGGLHTGLSLGIHVGLFVGSCVGFKVGVFVGTEVGFGVGVFVGPEVGGFVGTKVGFGVGVFVGPEVGFVVGEWVGGFVTKTDGKPVTGAQVGFFVGYEEVGMGRRRTLE